MLVEVKFTEPMSYDTAHKLEKFIGGSNKLVRAGVPSYGGDIRPLDDDDVLTSDVYKKDDTYYRVGTNEEVSNYLVYEVPPEDKKVFFGEHNYCYTVDIELLLAVFPELPFTVVHRVKVKTAEHEFTKLIHWLEMGLAFAVGVVAGWL